MHFDIAGVLGPLPPSGVCVDEVTHSLEHQNMRVESAVPGYHALLLEHQRLSGHSDDEESSLHRHSGHSGGDLREPFLTPVAEAQN